MLQEECQYVNSGKKMLEDITNDTEISFVDDSDSEGSDEENSDKKILIRKLLWTKINTECQ